MSSHPAVAERLSGIDVGDGHEQVVFCQDERSGLRAIIAIYSTALGPALGGTRFHPYPDQRSALQDVLRLAKGMAYKNALAGLDLGGGKAVIVGDPAVHRTETLLRAYGRFVESLGGRYITACDVGTTSADMDVVALESRHVTGRSEAHGGAGDSSLLTAYGLMEAMRAAAERIWSRWGLTGRRVGVSGVGKVGARLVEMLVEAGATVLVHDVDGAAVHRIQRRFPGVLAVPDGDELLAADLDVFAPCALGGVLDERSVRLLGARLVCGGANNQLADENIAKVLHERGILYAPDYLVNAGGVIQVADELHGYLPARARRRAEGIGQTLRTVLEQAERDGVTPTEAADALAETRMREVSALRSIHLTAR
jgi:valine dehydrogenase (NAD+)